MTILFKLIILAIFVVLYSIFVFGVYRYLLNRQTHNQFNKVIEQTKELREQFEQSYTNEGLIDTAVEEEQIQTPALIVNQTITTNMQQNYSSNKNIFMCGNDKLLTPEIKLNMQKIRETNPDYKFCYFDDEKMEKFMQEEMDDVVYDAYMKVSHPVMKADFFRYCIVYKRGGVYLDLKSGPKKPLSQIITEENKDKLLVGTWMTYSLLPSYFAENLHWCLFDKGEYMQWFIASPSHHPAMKAVIDQVVYNITVLFPHAYKTFDEKVKKRLFYGSHGVFLCTGPIAYTYAIEKYIEKRGNKDIVNMGCHNESHFPFKYNTAYSATHGHQKVNKNHYSKALSGKPVVIY